MAIRDRKSEQPLRLGLLPGAVEAPLRALAAHTGRPLEPLMGEQPADLPAGIWLVVEPGGRVALGAKDFKRWLRVGEGEVARRRQGGRKAIEQLLKALGARPGRPAPRVLDATCGLAREALLLAACGVPLEAAERSPGLCALVGSGAPDLALHPGPAAELLQPGRWEVVYFDFMYPEGRRSAAPGWEMQLVARLLAAEGFGPPDPEEEADLLERARRCAPRVVVKRPRRAPHPGAVPPSFSVKGRGTRFDVWLR